MRSWWICLLFIIGANCSSKNVRFMSGEESKAEGETTVFQKLSLLLPEELQVSEELPLESPKESSLLHFRIGNDATVYFHKSTENYHQMIKERLALYSLLSKISEAVESLDIERFERILVEDEGSIGFCMRFHLVILILNDFQRKLESVKVFTKMIEALSRMKTLEFPNEIVAEQFDALSERTEAIIETIDDVDFVSIIRNYLNIEAIRIK